MKKLLFCISASAFLFLCAINLFAVQRDSSSVGKTGNQAFNIENTRTFNYSASSDVALSREMTDYLDTVTDYLKNHKQARVRIVGHSDNTGTLKENTERSKSRADAARDYIVSKGVSPARILQRGVGSTMPVVAEQTEADRNKNRRIEITVDN
jgi:outer membrane protein OmpA-like peptidoglycan-associated protein